MSANPFNPWLKKHLENFGCGCVASGSFPWWRILPVCFRSLLSVAFGRFAVASGGGAGSVCCVVIILNKPVKLVLALSIAANAIWLIGAAAGWFSFGKASGKTSGLAQSGGIGVIDALSPKAAKDVVALFSTNDAVALRDQLRAFGLPDDVVREVVQERIARRYEARYMEITKAARDDAAQRPYWQLPPSLWNNLTIAQRTEMLMLYREEWKQVRQILGRDGEIPSQASIIHAYLPPDRAEQFAEMENYYYLMRAEVFQVSSRFRTPGDNEKLMLLDDEHKRDIDAMLTPDGKRENNLRNSLTARDPRFPASMLRRMNIKPFSRYKTHWMKSIR